jgi:DNA-binding transcriptional ArsR family regulator
VTLSLVFIVTISFAALVQKQKNGTMPFPGSNGLSQSAGVNSFSFNLLMFPKSESSLFLAPSVRWVDAAETPASALNNSTRTELYDFIKANPSIQFRGICNELWFSIGLAQFHLGVLTKTELISFFRDGKYKRFFESKRFSKKQMKIISVLRHETAGSILRVILERKQVSHGELTHELSITSQGLTWQMNRLRKNHLIVESKANKKLLYSIEYANAALLTEMAKLTEQA